MRRRFILLTVAYRLHNGNLFFRYNSTHPAFFCKLISGCQSIVCPTSLIVEALFLSALIEIKLALGLETGELCCREKSHVTMVLTNEWF